VIQELFSTRNSNNTEFNSRTWVALRQQIACNRPRPSPGALSLRAPDRYHRSGCDTTRCRCPGRALPVIAQRPQKVGDIVKQDIELRKPRVLCYMTNDRRAFRSCRAAVGLVLGLALAACGGGGGSSSPQAPANVAPVSNAGADQSVAEQTTVQLSGSGSDANSGDRLTYAWTQQSGVTVSINNASQAQANFTAPALQNGTPEVLVFRLTVTDNRGLSSSDDVTVTVLAPGAVVTISGVASYEFVPPNPGCVGLNYNGIQTRPIRGATVQIVNAANNAVLGSAVTDDSGAYAISVDSGISVFVRIRAELKRGGTPSWDVEVRDNTAVGPNPAAPVPLKQRFPYVLDTGNFNSGVVDQTRNVTATTGWNGTSYASTRAAAPFAILDAIYSGMLLVLSVDSSAEFAPLDAFWSVNNSLAQGAGTPDENIASGEIGTSFYRSDRSLFLLGKADEDTEEFDDHVIVHEWGHYFEDAFSRSDSIGGPHGGGDRLDMRLAFGEGWATALSGIALENATYCDTSSTRQSSGFSINIETSSPSPRGWFNEFSVMALIYDLWDDSLEIGRGDSGSIGFGPIYDTMVNRQAVTAAHTSIFTFTDELVSESPSSAALVDELRTYHNINGTGVHGDNETNHGNSATPQDVLPVYTDVATNGAVTNVCVNREHDNTGSDGNKLGEHRFLRFAVSVPSRYAFNIQVDAATAAMLPPNNPANDRDQSDPDANVFLNGQFVAQGVSGDANSESFTSFNVLGVGNYVMDLTEFRYADEQSVAGFPDRVCFDVTVQPTP
jgi:K319L-like, PKD domain